MAADPPERLKEALVEIRKRWGTDALRLLSAVKVSSTHIPTGFPALDALLMGGIPCGRVAELSGVPTSGMPTLALKIVAAAQAQGRLTVYVDLAHLFDPGHALHCGVRLDNLLIARPDNVADGLDILHIVAAEGGAGLVVLDSTAEILAKSRGVALLNAALRKLAPALRQSGCTALFLSLDRPVQSVLHHVAVRLNIENVGWIEQEQDVSGVRARVTVLRNERARPGQQVEIALSLNDPAQEEAA